MRRKEERDYYTDVDGNIYDETCEISSEWIKITWDEVEELIRKKKEDSDA